MIENLLNNQFASGGLILVVLGYVAYHLKALPTKVFNTLKRVLIIECEIQDRDAAYAWLAKWLSEHDYCKKAKRISVVTKWSRLSRDDSNTPDSASNDSRPSIHFIPAPGVHLIQSGCWFLINRSRKDATGSDFASLLEPETFNIRTFKWNREKLVGLLESAKDVALPVDSGKLSVYVGTWGHWSQAYSIDGRDKESVILENNGIDKIISDLREFLSKHQWYRKRGIPWRRGWLLTGPPGNGKTSVIKAVATELKLNLGVINLSNPSLTDNYLIQLFNDASENTIIALEDVDCAFNKRDTKDATEHISISGLLNAIDGVSSADGRILFMTTNHKEKLDSALIRPGRADQHLELGYPGKTEARELFKRFRGNYIDVDEFASLADGKTSMAALQGVLLK